MTEYAQLLESIAVIIASGAALYGVSSWKREVKWKRETEFNEEVLFQFYVCHDTIKYIRNFAMFDINNSTYIPTDKLSPSQNESLKTAQVIFDRFYKHIDTFSNLKKLKFRFKAIYPDKSLEPFDIISECINDVLRAAQMLGHHYWQFDITGKSEEVISANNKKIAEFESILYYDYSEPDIIDNKIIEAIKQIESLLNHKS